MTERTTTMRYQAFLLLTLGTLLLTACGGSSGGAAPEPTAETAIEGAVPASLTFKSGIFAGEYMRDAAATDAKVRGKLVEVTGMVSTFGTNKDNVAYVNIQGASRGAPIQCVFAEPGPKESFSGLTQGQQSTVRGIAEGYSETVKDEEGQFALFMSQGDIITLSDCSVVR